MSLNDVGIDIRYERFSRDVGKVNLHPTKGSHWVAYMNQNYFDPYGLSPPEKLSKFLKNINGSCSSLKHKLQGLRRKRAFFNQRVVYIYST